MKKENYFNQMLKIELAVGKQYGDTRLLAMKEFLEDIPDDEWPCVVRDAIKEFNGYEKTFNFNFINLNF